MAIVYQSGVAQACTAPPAEIDTGGWAPIANHSCAPSMFNILNCPNGTTWATQVITDVWWDITSYCDAACTQNRSDSNFTTGTCIQGNEIAQYGSVATYYWTQQNWTLAPPGGLVSPTATPHGHSVATPPVLFHGQQTAAAPVLTWPLGVLAAVVVGMRAS